MNTAICPSTTLADLITAHPDLGGALERRSLDYCCGGARTLAEACRSQWMDAETVARELMEATTAPPAPWADLGAAALVDHIETTTPTSTANFPGSPRWRARSERSTARRTRSCARSNRPSWTSGPILVPTSPGG